MNVKTIFENMTYGPAPESAQNAEQWIESHQKKFQLFIDGQWHKPSSKKYLQSVNPATEEKLARIAWGGKKDIDHAVKAAKKALPGWSGLSGHQRARYLYAIARHFQKNSRLFAVLESLDNGKTIRETRDIDIPLVARHFYYHAGWAQLQEKEFVDFQEVGVVGQIIPWNFPLMMLAWKIAPAIAMGNTVVLKPAELTSLTALLFAEICQQAGLPKGVVNIVTGAGDTGALLVDHPLVNKVAFTGSTRVGKIIRTSIAGSGKKVSLELGGKSPFMVFDDADLDSVVEGVVDAIWFNQGQVCCAGSRLLVQESVANKLYKKIRARMEKLRIGSSLDKSVDIGAIVSPMQLNTIETLVKKGIDEGGTLWQPSWACPSDGFFYPPSLFTDVSPSSTIAQVEIFGPVLVAMTFRTHQEAVKLANNTRYGLAASIWTENINLALDIAPKVKAGSVWINCTNVFDAASGFGGYRESGFGREGGKEGLYEYLKPKLKLSDKPIKRAVSRRAVKSNGSLKIDRTAKMYIGGKQARPDGGYSLPVLNPGGVQIGEVGDGNRKDIRNAVEAAHSGAKWRNMSGHARAQVIYYLAENLEARKEEFIQRLVHMSGLTSAESQLEVELSIDRLFTYAAYADKYDGLVHNTLLRNVTLAMPEAIGVMALVCPQEFPLLGFISTLVPLIAMGNTVVVVPSEVAPLCATDFYQVMDTSDVPAGTINIVTGNQQALSEVLSSHYDVDGMWYFGTSDGSKLVEESAAENMKRTWVNYGKFRDWRDPKQACGEEFLRQATQIKNIWIPYGA